MRRFRIKKDTFFYDCMLFQGDARCIEIGTGVWFALITFFAAIGFGTIGLVDIW